MKSFEKKEIIASIAAAVYAGFSLLFRPSKKIGDIDADSIEGGDEMLRRLETAKDGFLKIESSMRNISNASVRSEAEKLHSLSSKIIG